MRQGNPPSNNAKPRGKANQSSDHQDLASENSQTGDINTATGQLETTTNEISASDASLNEEPGTQLYCVSEIPRVLAPDTTETCEASSTSTASETPSNVINIFTGQVLDEETSVRIIRVSGECNGARMLYSTLDNPERLVAVPILCWALLEDGAVTALVPWLDEVLPCEEIEQKYSINWEGYYCAIAEDFFFEPPPEVVAQLSVAARFNSAVFNTISNTNSNTAAAIEERADWHIVQEIPDPIGTHALLLNEASDALVLTSVISWSLDEYGRLHGMLADDASIEKLPVLPGDDCLFCAEDEPSFKCFFQRDIAEQIRVQNPETMQAIEQLFGAS